MGKVWGRSDQDICNLVVVVMFPTTTTNDQCPLRLLSKIVKNPVNYCRAFHTKGKSGLTVAQPLRSISKLHKCREKEKGGLECCANSCLLQI
jgi:hypothetical protein